MMTRMQRRLYLVALFLLAAGGLAGYASARFLGQYGSGNTTVVREGGYRFVNPLIACDISSQDAPYGKFRALQNKLQALSNNLIDEGEATRISVYFRDMDHGYWTGVKTNDLFASASLMKVPLLMAYLGDTNSDAQFLRKTLTLSVPADQNSVEYFKPAAPLSIGVVYTVQELLAAMIEQSDNNAMYVLANNVDTPTLDGVYEDANVPPSVDEAKDSVSPQDYMHFFRILYNATLLGKERSQLALELLSKTTFSGGLVAGVPAGTTVAHKFGERTIKTQDVNTGTISFQKDELHDCGIVYFPAHPYGICVMTEGKDFGKLENVIAQLSQAAYTSVKDGLLVQ